MPVLGRNQSLAVKGMQLHGSVGRVPTNASSEAPRRPASLSIQSARNRSSSASSLASVTSMLMPGMASLALHRSALAREAWASRGLREGQITMDDLARRAWSPS